MNNNFIQNIHFFWTNLFPLNENLADLFYDGYNHTIVTKKGSIALT